MELSRSIKEKIKGWEGCLLRTYRCSAGVLTIGYGHTGPDVHVGMQITKQRADELFEADIARFASTVEKVLAGARLKQCQFDALVSLSYNIGYLPRKAPTLLKKVNADADDATIRDEFMKHVNARVDGVLKPLKGLQIRRAAEADHYFGKS